MALRIAERQVEHDRVVYASAGLLQRKFEDRRVTVNPDHRHNMQIGREGKTCYPDVLMWQPESTSSMRGSVELICEVETADSTTEEESAQWNEYGKIPITFCLVVPKEKERDAVRIVKKNSVHVSQLWTYEIAGDNIYLDERVLLPDFREIFSSQCSGEMVLGCYRSVLVRKSGFDDGL
jgi:hypothetical protein